PDGLGRGGVLVSPDRWHFTSILDARAISPLPRIPHSPQLHIGVAAVPCRLRVLGDDLVRVTLESALPLRVGDRAVLRDPDSRGVWGLHVLDPAPPRLTRRGAARGRAERLTNHPG